VELWKVPAQELLQAGDIGLIPWVPLTDFADPPETMLQRCRAAIEQHAPSDEKANLLAVTQVLTFLRYNSVDLLTILGGKEVMLEVPFVDEIVMEKYGNLLTEKTREVERETARRTACETAQRSILTVLETRFGEVPPDLVEEIELVDEEEQLQAWTRTAVACRDLDAFRDALARS
jgi:hypothetical protein